MKILFTLGIIKKNNTMKKILPFLLLCISGFAFAQELEPVLEELQPFNWRQHTLNNGMDRQVTCDADTVLYLSAKATASSGLSINNATSAYAISQYFDAPQDITIEGAQFVGRKADNTNGITIDVTVEIYLAGADSLPTGAALASETITIDTNFYGGSIAALTKTVSFANPVTVSAPYIMVVENNTATPVTLYSNSYTAGDGDMEWLASANIGGNWTRSYAVVVGGTPYDADMYFHPVVNYEITNDFTLTPDCGTPGTITFDVTNSPIMSNRMYSSAVFLGSETAQYTWDWDDGSTDNVLDTTHDYSTAGPFNVTYTDSLLGWESICVDTTVKSTCSSGSGAGIEDATVGFNIFPNPASGVMTISSTENMEFVELFDISGKLVYSENLTGIKQKQISVDSYAAGSYIIKVKLVNGDIIQDRLEISK